MATELREEDNLEQQLAYSSRRIQELIDQHYSVEVTRSLQLCFSTSSQDCACALSKALFAKGMRILTRDPEHKSNGRWAIRAGVKRSVRDAVREEFVADLVHTAFGMHGSYDGWNLLADEAAEESQQHIAAPGDQSATVAA